MRLNYVSVITYNSIQKQAIGWQQFSFQIGFCRDQTYADGNFRGYTLLWQQMEVQRKFWNSAFLITSQKLKDLSAWP